MYCNEAGCRACAVHMDQTYGGEGGDSEWANAPSQTRTKPEYTSTQVITLCQQLEDACLQFGELGVSFHLSKQLRELRACVRKEEILGAKQTTIDSVNSKQRYAARLSSVTFAGGHITSHMSHKHHT